MTHTPLSVVIVGAGFAGHAAAISLLSKFPRPIQLAMIEAGGGWGGLAYARASHSHLLNTRAGQFTVLAGEADDFASWARTQVIASGPVVDLSETFLPREMVCDYLRQRLHEAAAAHRRAAIMYVSGKVTSVSRPSGLWRAQLGIGNWIDADVLVLATGYGHKRRRNFGLDPFGELGTGRVRKASRVAMVGTGLTFVDTWQRLQSMGFHGNAVAFSRTGQLPEPHACDAVEHIVPEARPGMTLREIVRSVRRQVEGLQPGQDWRGLINGLRDRASALWAALTEADKERFQRHVSSYWQKLRHRVAPDIHASVLRDIEDGRLVLRRARVSSVRKLWNGWNIILQHAGQQEKLTGFDLVFDCTAPSVQSVMALVAPLVEDGLARPGPCGAGIDVDAAGAVRNARGEAVPGLFAVGPVGQGALLEIKGAPEIVSQAERLAECVLALADAGKSHASLAQRRA